MTISINLSELLPKHFHSLWKATKDSEKLNIVAKGGRGSGKSSDISIIITQLIMRRVQMSNREFAKELWKRGYQSDEIYCDSAEPKVLTS